MKTNRFLLICATAAALGSASCSLRSQTPPQPVFHGRTLAEWLVKYEYARADAERLESSNAVMAIGTNAIPTLVEWVHDGVITGQASAYSSGARLALAFVGFKILGLASRRAVPALVAVARESNPVARHNAVWCLVEAIPADRETVLSILQSLRSDPDCAVRRQVKLYLEQLNPCSSRGLLPLPRPMNRRQEVC